MSRYYTKLGQNATYLRVYEDDKLLQGEEVIDVIQNFEKRIAELEHTLTKVRDLLNEQEDKECLGTGYPVNSYECAPWAIVDEVINEITRKLLAKGGDL